MYYMLILLRLVVAALLTVLLPLTAATWTGPSVSPVWNADGVSALSIDGEVSAPGFLVGNTQGGLADDWAAWDVELRHAAAAGVRIFGVCTDGSDLLSQPQVVLANRTRDMVERVRSARNMLFRSVSVTGVGARSAEETRAP